MADRFYFRQLLSGRDFATADPMARQMVNFTYLIGDREKGEALVVDPAYGVGELVELLAADGLRLTGVLATHYHADHIGGSIFGHDIEGVRELLGRTDVDARIHVQAPEAPMVKQQCGVSDSDLVCHDSGDVVMVGDIPVTLMHTPGHTPGSQCFHVDGRLIAGDTLFLEGCGRTDLPGGDPDVLYDSLVNKLAVVPDDTILYPGHLYSEEASAALGEVRMKNFVFRISGIEQWRMMMGH